MKPLIGISVNYMNNDRVARSCGLGADGQDFNYVAGDYVAGIERAGGIPVLIPQCYDFADLGELLSRLDGILISGGHDVDPQLYGEVNVHTGRISPERDAEDIYMAKYALEHDLPVLGICRGVQIMNVADGGTLYQDVLKQANAQLDHFGISYPRNFPCHHVSFAPESRLNAIFGAAELHVNSYHHQAVKTAGKSSFIAAVSQDGIPEAIEFGNLQFAIGVQWHPEMMFDSALQAKLFEAFVESAAARQKSGSLLLGHGQPLP